ncbi:hypothetical protein A4H97_03775 [Niastella yeongjuensis]|uniref:Secretion system C-terminal sorting domain-containing protein n=1 Tax=Niastella yeongjuensis TaxID=354355 RepID=A0A1V9EXW2_9BACT|nr:T9SS type A sorting domain-containing protein [Niastella yeongjuensis]OQP50952.1 hypothetical protein A4H97_03775 [Niastella yeongjuensis]SEN09862.1 conserved repeat domain-containing protein/Por secretion system C-terminal sorting domain-containing protein [Niastella yeongjuensis]
MSFKFYPLKALLLGLVLLGIKANTQAQLVFTKEVKNTTTGGDGTLANMGDELLYTITVKNNGTQNYIAAKMYDNVPPGVIYKTGSTVLNTTTLTDKPGGIMPYAGDGNAVNAENYMAGVLPPGQKATVMFRVTVTGNGGSIFNNATIDATQGNVSTIQATNTVYTNIQKDAGCNIIYQTTPAVVSFGRNTPDDQKAYSWVRTVDTITGKGSAVLYDGPNGATKSATTGNNVSGPLLDGCAAIAYDKASQRIYFVNNVAGANLSYIDMSTSPPLSAYRWSGTPLSTNGVSVNRMGMGSDGYCYALTSDASDLIRFKMNSSGTPVINHLGPLTNANTNGGHNVRDARNGETGGDIFADGSGKLYLITNNSSMYKINPATLVATYMGTMKVNGQVVDDNNPFTSQSLAIDLYGNVFINGAYNEVFKLDLQTMNAVSVNSGSSGVYMSGDYTTCAFPVLNSSIIAKKTYTDIDGDGHINGGDTVEYKITVTNIGNINAAGVYMYDYIPPSTTYIKNTTKMNGIAVPDASGGVMPFAKTGTPNGKMVNTLGEDPGIVLPTQDNSAVVTFRVRTEPNKQVCNQSKITLTDADGNIMFVNSSDPTNTGQTPTCFYSDGVLPLINLKFKGALQEQKSVLNWTMNGDDGVATYDVEYSENGTVFTKAGTVAAKENSNIANSYQFTDAEHTFSTTRWYRLRVNQKGGSVNYSGVIMLNTNKLDVEAMPNPFDRDVNVQILVKSAEQVRIRLIDFSGREVYTTSEQLAIGSNSISIRIPAGLSKGMYMLDIRSGKEVLFQKKLLKK